VNGLNELNDNRVQAAVRLLITGRVYKNAGYIPSVPKDKRSLRCVQGRVTG
jgi:hypothetical protein